MHTPQSSRLVHLDHSNLTVRITPSSWSTNSPTGHSSSKQIDRESIILGSGECGQHEVVLGVGGGARLGAAQSGEGAAAQWGILLFNYPLSDLCAGFVCWLVGGTWEEATGEVLVTQQLELSADSVSLTLEEGRLVLVSVVLYSCLYGQVQGNPVEEGELRLVSISISGRQCRYILGEGWVNIVIKSCINSQVYSTCVAAVGATSLHCLRCLVTTFPLP